MMMSDGLSLNAMGSAEAYAMGGAMLSNRQKAAVVVRYLLDEGEQLPLSQFSEPIQAVLAEEMGQLRLIDRETLEMVLHEFSSQVESVGLAFPGGLEGALQAMDGQISHSTAIRLRRKAGVDAKADPWDRLSHIPVERLAAVVENEGVDVAAVIMSKLPVARAAEVMNRLPGPKARRIAAAFGQTGDVNPNTVRRIGMAILAQIDALPPTAFDRAASERVGAILNVSSSATRDAVLNGLTEEDAAFADEVRKSIFTYAHIPQRISARDVPKIIRLIDQPSLITALAYAQGRPELEPASEFLLASISQRMAQTLRDEIPNRGRVKDKEAEAAFALILGAIRQLQALGELVMLIDGEEEDA